MKKSSRPPKLAPGWHQRRTGRLKLDGIEPGSHHYTGIFNADDVASFADMLAREGDLIVRREGGDYLVRPAPALE